MFVLAERCQIVQENLCAFQYHCFRFFYSVRVSGVSIPIYFKLCKKRLSAGYFFIYVFFVFFLGILNSFHCFDLFWRWVWFVHLIVGLGQCLAYTFLILRRQVVSITCEKCLLYSFKKFQAEYKTLYINLSISTCSEGVLSVCWVQRSDSCFFCFCQ